MHEQLFYVAVFLWLCALLSGQSEGHGSDLVFLILLFNMLPSSSPSFVGVMCRADFLYSVLIFYPNVTSDISLIFQCCCCSARFSALIFFVTLLFMFNCFVCRIFVFHSSFPFHFRFGVYVVVAVFFVVVSFHFAQSCNSPYFWFITNQTDTPSSCTPIYLRKQILFSNALCHTATVM